MVPFFCVPSVDFRLSQNQSRLLLGNLHAEGHTVRYLGHRQAKVKPEDLLYCASGPIKFFQFQKAGRAFWREVSERVAWQPLEIQDLAFVLVRCRRHPRNLSRLQGCEIPRTSPRPRSSANTLLSLRCRSLSSSGPSFSPAGPSLEGRCDCFPRRGRQILTLRASATWERSCPKCINNSVTSRTISRPGVRVRCATLRGLSRRARMHGAFTVFARRRL